MHVVLVDRLCSACITVYWKWFRGVCVCVASPAGRLSEEGLFSLVSCLRLPVFSPVLIETDSSFQVSIIV